MGGNRQFGEPTKQQVLSPATKAQKCRPAKTRQGKAEGPHPNKGGGGVKNHDTDQTANTPTQAPERKGVAPNLAPIPSNSTEHKEKDQKKPYLSRTWAKMLGPRQADNSSRRTRDHEN